MSNLFQIDEQLRRCVKLESGDFADTETGEVIDVEAIEALEMERDKKLRNLGCWYLDLEAEVVALKSIVKKYQARIKSNESNMERIKGYTSRFLNGEKWKCTDCRYQWRESEAVELNDGVTIKDLPKEYWRFKEPEINREMIKKELKAGKEVVGCKLVKRNNMSIKP